MILGFYCPTGSSSATQIECPVGYFCPPGSPIYESCGDGSYAPDPGASACELCPAGRYCVADDVVPGDITTLFKPCPRGFYCPNGTGMYSWNFTYHLELNRGLGGGGA